MRYAVTVSRVTETDIYTTVVSWKFTDVEPYDEDLPSQTINLDPCHALEGQERATFVADTADEARSLAIRYAHEERKRYSHVLTELTESIRKATGS